MTGENIQRLLTEVVEKLKKTHGDALVSVVLYGSAAEGDHHAGYSDINLLCVLRQVTPLELAAAEPVFKWWREKGNPSPLLLSRHELETSMDCFPIEFHDIKSQNRILFGEDVVSGLAVEYRYHRSQVEHELRAKQLRLRQKAAGVLSDQDLLRRLLGDSLSTFCVLFRHAIVLAGGNAPMDKRGVIARAKDEFGIHTEPFDRLLDLREGKIKPRDLEPAPVFERYLREISVVIDAVDRLEK
ncbi:MAG: nucleotidyltransferase domain-containing protein [Bryobacterales bacterium]|nr:nucleotidyltransferase domain-containing protein [Bryobacterales bacterium]